jgi:hypothetical protein
MIYGFRSAMPDMTRRTDLTRRELLLLSAAPGLLCGAGLPSGQADGLKGSGSKAAQFCSSAFNCTKLHNEFAWQKPPSVRKYLELVTFRKPELDGFLDSHRPRLIRLDSELGYLLRDNVGHFGVDRATTWETYQRTGERKTISYAGQPCRVNTYGNSFTQCAQVSDGESWQEYLASHLGEPIRNFGIGGWGVYQAYRRMLHEEATSMGAEWLILNIYGIDDNFRSLDAWKWLRYPGWWRNRPNEIWMAPWPYARLNLDTGQLVEMENPFPTVDSLYQLTDPHFVYEHFKDDLIVQLLVAQWMGSGVNIDTLRAVAKFLRVEPRFNTPEETAQTARAMHLEYALLSSQRTIEKAQAFATERRKHLLVLLSYESDLVIDACNGLPRMDQSLVDFLKDNKIRYVDGLAKHLEDFHQFRIPAQEYARRYYNGHYKPQGNHFFAFAIKDTVVDWLDPKPPAYRPGMATVT